MSYQPPQRPPEGWERPQQQGWGQPPPQPPSGPPTQPQWGAAPPPPLPPQSPKPKPPLYRRPWFIIVGIVVLVVIAAGLFGDPPAEEQASQGTVAPTTAAQATNTPTTAAESEPETTGKPATTARESDLRRAVRDGQFEFVVKSVTCGKRTVGSAGLEEEAQGQFCLVAVGVKNIGKEARTFDASSQYLYDNGGRRFETDDATFYIEDFGKAFLENINPGNEVDGTLVYDVPRSGFKAAKLELHDSPFSGGVEVNL